MKVATNIHHVSGKSFRGQRSNVKDKCVQMCECNNGGGIHFDGVASRLTAVSFLFLFLIRVLE